MWRVDCDDYTNQVDRRLVVEVYEGVSASDIFTDIAAKYCPGFTTKGVQLGAPAVEYIRFDYIHPSECFKQLCEYVGWQWRPDYYKDLHFFDPAILLQPAPMSLEPGGPFRLTKHTVDMQGLRNRVYVVGGKYLSDPVDHAYVSDGVQREWVLPHEPHSPRVVVGDVSNPEAVPGLESVDDEANYIWMYNQREKYIRLAAGQSVPAVGTTIIFRYKEPMDVITMAEDEASQHALSLVQGGDGVYEHRVADSSLITIAAAEALGQQDLREHANPKVSGSFEVVEKPGAVEEASWQTAFEKTEPYVPVEFYGQEKAAQKFEALPSLGGARHVKVSVHCAGRWGPGIPTHWQVYTDDSGLPGESISTRGYGVLHPSLWPYRNEHRTVEIELDKELESGKSYWFVLEFAEIYNPDSSFFYPYRF